MQSSQAPDKFAIPFANSAGSSYIRPVPQGSQVGIENGAASLETGFPPLNFLPVGSGGVPPFGQDMNGILRQITQWSRWQAAGALNLWDGAFATAIGGYPRGALLTSTTAGVTWLNTIENNLTNPDGGTAAGWQAVLTGASVPQTSLIHAGPDTSTTAGVITIPALMPGLSSLGNYQQFEIVPANAIVGATNVTIQNFGAVPLKRSDGGDPQAGDGPAGQPFLAMFYNGALVRLGLSPSQIATQVANGPAVTNYLTQNYYAPPGSGFAGNQGRFGYLPVTGQNSNLQATFTCNYASTIICMSILNTSPDNGNIGNAASVTVNGTRYTGTADSVSGSSTSVSIVTVPRGATVMAASDCMPTQTIAFNASQYLVYTAIPS